MSGSNRQTSETKPKMNWERFKSSLFVFKYIKPYKWSFIIGLILLFLSSLMFFTLVPLGGKMLDIAMGESKLGISLGQAGMILIVLLIVQGVISYFRILMFANVSEKAISDLRKELYQHLLSLPFSFYEKSRVGELSSRISGDADQLYNAFNITLAEFIRQIIVLLGGVIYLLVVSTRLSLVMLAVFPVIVIGAMIFGKYIRKESKQRQEALANTNTIVDETMQAIFAVKSFSNEEYEYKRYETKIDQLVHIALRLSKFRSLFGTYIIVALFGALFFIIWTGINYVQQKIMTPGDLVNVFTLTSTVGISIVSLGNFYTQLMSVIGGTERIQELLAHQPEIIFNQAGHPIQAPISAEVAFNNVVFNYPSRPDIQVLKKINFTIKAGQKVAFVGSSGVGKSTIAQLLLRFYDIQSGEITVGQKNIKSYPITDYRSFFGIVPQEVMLFGGTIRENILYGKPLASDAEVIEAARQSNSWDFISGFPEGMETIVGERGIKLSGGQKQRIAIARALLKNPSILILDEATSALDAESEQVVQQALKILMEGRTSIIIAHRLATIRDVDCIYVLEDGKIVEQGTHDQLSNTNGAYSRLARLQFDSNKELASAGEAVPLSQ